MNPQPQRICRISDEDLAALRAINAKEAVFMRNPGFYSVTEAEQIHLRKFQLIGSIYERYLPEETRHSPVDNFLVNAYTGEVWV